MTADEIKTRLKAKKLSQRRLARRLRISQTAANFAVNRKLITDRIDRGLARELGVSVDELRGCERGAA